MCHIKFNVSLKNILQHSNIYIYIYIFWLRAAKKEGQVRKLKDDKCRLETEVETLERKVERMGAMQKQVRNSRGHPSLMAHLYSVCNVSDYPTKVGFELN